VVGGSIPPSPLPVLLFFPAPAAPILAPWRARGDAAVVAGCVQGAAWRGAHAHAGPRPPAEGCTRPHARRGLRPPLKRCWAVLLLRTPWPQQHMRCRAGAAARSARARAPGPRPGAWGGRGRGAGGRPQEGRAAFQHRTRARPAVGCAKGRVRACCCARGGAPRPPGGQAGGPRVLGAQGPTAAPAAFSAPASSGARGDDRRGTPPRPGARAHAARGATRRLGRGAATSSCSREVGKTGSEGARVHDGSLRRPRGARRALRRRRHEGVGGRAAAGWPPGPDPGRRRGRRQFWGGATRGAPTHPCRAAAVRGAQPAPASGRTR
jgi:hypothetical protein